MSVKTTISGNVGKTPKLSKVTLKDGSSKDVCSFSVASSDYRRVGDDFEQIGETAWVECNLWGDKASHLIKVLQKGMPVIVTGAETLRKNEDNGQVYINRIMNVEQIGLNLLSPRVEEIKLRPAKEGENEAPDAAEASDSNIPF